MATPATGLNGPVRLADALERGDVNAEELRRKVILPSSFIGSPRHIIQLYQDAMSIVRK